MMERWLVLFGGYPTLLWEENAILEYPLPAKITLPVGFSKVILATGRMTRDIKVIVEQLIACLDADYEQWRGPLLVDNNSRLDDSFPKAEGLLCLGLISSVTRR